MGQRRATIVLLSEMTPGDEGDFFAQLSAKQQLTTRDGKPYFRVAFRDAGREVSFPIWSDSPWATDCREAWTPGEFYKLRATYRETAYGPQLEIDRIRPARAEDEADGFDPQMLLPRSRFDPQSMLEELIAIISEEVSDAALQAFLVSLLDEHSERLMTLPAAKRYHHAFAGGFLEHVLNVTRNCVFLAEQYRRIYASLQPPLDKDLVVAGAVLHDIGKLRELELLAEGARYTVEGELIGHVLLGRDMVREHARAHPIDEERLLRLEHLIVAHQRLPEWGSPKEPMTLEALIVHHADDLDAKLQMMVAALNDSAGDGPFTSRNNPLGVPIFRGLPERGLGDSAG